MLERILESKPQSRILSFFVVNPGRSFSILELNRKFGGRNLQTHLNALLRYGALKSSAKKGIRFYKLNSRYRITPSFKNQAHKSERKYADELARSAGKLKGLKALVMTGMFTGNPKLECDMVIVGKPSMRALTKIIAEAERAAGQEINYAVFSEQEFDYRRNIFDRFMKDVFENDYHFLINKIK